MAQTTGPTGVEALLAPFRGTTTPLVVQSKRTSLTTGGRVSTPDYRILPPLSGTPIPFDHVRWLMDQMALAPRREISVSGLVPPRPGRPSPLPVAPSGTLQVPSDVGPSTPIAAPASSGEQVVRVTGRSSQASTQESPGFSSVDLTSGPAEQSSPPYTMTDRQLVQRSDVVRKAQARYTAAVSQPEPEPDLSDMPSELKKLSGLVSRNRAAAEATKGTKKPVQAMTRGQVRKQVRFLTEKPEAASKGGLLEWLADRASELRDRSAARGADIENAEAALASTMAFVDPDAGSVEETRGLGRGRGNTPEGFVLPSGSGGGSSRRGNVRATAVPIYARDPEYSYTSSQDPFLAAASHVKGWAHALLTGDTSMLDRISDEVGQTPDLVGDDLPAPRRNWGSAANARHRNKAARIRGAQASVEHPVHQDLVSDLSSDISEGNFLYRLAQRHGVDPNEGHADRVLQNADEAIRTARATAANRTIGFPPSSTSGSETFLRSVSEVHPTTWINRALENVANQMIGERTRRLPMLRPGYSLPSAESVVIGDDPSSVKTRQLLQEQIDRYNSLTSPDGDVTAAISRSQQQAAPYLRPTLSPLPRREETPGLSTNDTEQDLFRSAFQEHRAGLIDAYRRSDAGKSLFPGGAAGQASVVAIGEAMKQTRTRNRNNARANGLEI